MKQWPLLIVIALCAVNSMAEVTINKVCKDLCSVEIGQNEKDLVTYRFTGGFKYNELGFTFNQNVKCVNPGKVFVELGAVSRKVCSVLYVTIKGEQSITPNQALYQHYPEFKSLDKKRYLSSMTYFVSLFKRAVINLSDKFGISPEITDKSSNNGVKMLATFQFTDTTVSVELIESGSIFVRFSTQKQQEILEMKEFCKGDNNKYLEQQNLSREMLDAFVCEN